MFIATWASQIRKHLISQQRVLEVGVRLGWKIALVSNEGKALEQLLKLW